MPSSIEIDVSANIAKFKTAMDKAALEGNKLNKKLDSAFKGVSKVMRGIGALAGVAVAGGLLAMGKRAIDAADNIEKLGRRTGATAEFLSEMRFSLSQNDVSMGEFETSLRKINKSTADAAAGLKTQTRAFDLLGISVDEFQKLGTDDKFIVLSEAISKVEDPATRTQVAMDLMGRSGDSLITVMEDGAEGIAKFRAESVKLGQSLSQDQVEKAAAANDAIDKLSKTISGTFSQAILDNIGFIEGFGRVIGDAKIIALGMIGQILIGLEHLKSGFKVAGEGLKLAFIAPIAFITDAFGEMVTKFGEFSSIFGENDISIAIKDFGDSVKNTLNPIDNFNEKVRQIGIEKDKAIAATRTLTSNMMDEAGAAKVVTNEVIKTGNAVSEFKFKTKKGTAALEENKSALKEQQKALKAAADEVKRLAKATGTDLIKSQDELNRTIDESIEYTKNYSKALETAREVLLSRGLIEGTKEYENALKSLGFETEKVTTVMSEHWERFADGAFDSFKTFTQSAFTDFKSFGSDIKTLAKGLVADLIATFASNKLKNIIANLFGGETKFPSLGSDKGGFDLSSLATVKNIISQGAKLLGIGSSVAASTAAAASAATSVATVVTTAAAAAIQVSTAAAASAAGISSGVAAVQVAIDAAAAGASAGTLGTAGASGATAAGTQIASIAGPLIAAAASIAIGRKLADGTGKTGKLLGTLGGTAGGLTARALASLGIIGNARSPQELGEDQLRAVDTATKEGRNTQVGLGQAGSTSLSFLGGFDENSIFFGVDLAKEQLQKVGDVFREMTGANQALALKDGVIRIEDFNRKFSENNDTIVAQLKASIIQVELGITESEKSIIASIGGNLTELDRLFDASAGNGETAAQRLAQAYSEATNSNIQAGQDWVNSAGIDADRIAQIFGASSAEVTASLFGVSMSGQEAFADLASGANDQINSIASSIGSLGIDAGNTLRLIQGGLVGVESSTQSAARLFDESRNNLTVVQGGNNGDNQQGQSGNQGLSPDAQAIVAEMKQQTVELREARLKPSGR